MIHPEKGRGLHISPSLSDPLHPFRQVLDRFNHRIKLGLNPVQQKDGDSDRKPDFTDERHHFMHFSSPPVKSRAPVPKTGTGGKRLRQCIFSNVLLNKTCTFHAGERRAG